jgi:hypothetical protein
LSLVAAVCLVACGGSGSPVNVVDGGADSDVVTCQNDPRVDPYSANLTKKSMSGSYQIVLEQADPAPPGLDINNWIIKVEDASGTPMSNPTLGKVVPFMPDHGHGTTIPTVTPETDGTISVTNLYFFMGGVWRVEFNPQSSTDPVDFFFCIAG